MTWIKEIPIYSRTPNSLSPDPTFNFTELKSSSEPEPLSTLNSLLPVSDWHIYHRTTRWTRSLRTNGGIEVPTFSQHVDFYVLKSYVRSRYWTVEPYSDVTSSDDRRVVTLTAIHRHDLGTGLPLSSVLIYPFSFRYYTTFSGISVSLFLVCLRVFIPQDHFVLKTLSKLISFWNTLVFRIFF